MEGMLAKVSYAHCIKNWKSHLGEPDFEIAKSRLGHLWDTRFRAQQLKKEDSLEAGKHLQCFQGDSDHHGRRFLAFRIPGDASVLGNLSNADITGILYTIHHVYQGNAEHSRTPAYVLADRFDDRLVARFDTLQALIPTLILLPIRNIIHADPEHRGRQVSGAEGRFAEGLAERIRSTGELAGHPLTVLGVEVPAGWALSRNERIDILGVDHSGRPIVLEIKALEDGSVSRIRGSVFQGLRYVRWVSSNRRALQIAYGRDVIPDLDAKPALYIVNAGANLPGDVLRFAHSADRDGTEVLIRFFRCSSADAVSTLIEVQS